MSLNIGDTWIPVQQMGPDFLLITPQSEGREAGVARLTLRVDASEREWNVSLPHGVPRGASKIMLALIDA